MANLQEKKTLLATEVEYEELASELHDGISQQLVTILWQLEEIRNLDNKEAMDTELSKVSDHLREVTNDLQRIIYGIRPVSLDLLGLQEGLKTWASSQLSVHGIKFTFHQYPGLLELPRFTSGQIFRVIQEGINNVIRHARAKHVNLLIERVEDYVVITLTDDGRGFDKEGIARGLGLQLIHERAISIKSEVQINSQPGGGTTLKIFIPYRGDEKR